MKRERAKELLPIIQAFAEGKVLQVKNGNDPWKDVGANDFSAPDFEESRVQWRVKPELALPLNVNMNDTIRVKLTVHGHEAHVQQHKKFWEKSESPPPYKPPQQDEEGWSEWTLWELMSTFGSQVHMGCDILFVNNTIQFPRFEQK